LGRLNRRLVPVASERLASGVVAAECAGDGLGLAVEGDAVDVLGALRHGTHGIGRVVVHALEFLRESLVGGN